MKKGVGMGGGGFILFYSLAKQLCLLWQLGIIFSNKYFFILGTTQKAGHRGKR